VLAFAQDDLKRLVAYSSISHLGFVLLGIFAWTPLALQGAVIQMIAHGLSTGALFMLAGAIQERLHTRDLREMQGLWSAVPKMAALSLFFAVASLGLPGLGNFVGEFLVLLGTYPVNVPLTVLATVGLVTATIYSLVLMQRTFYGQLTIPSWRLHELSTRALVMFGAVVALEIWLGLYPQPALNTAKPALAGLQAAVERAMVSQR
jgi:NADH-quinone oxidoreductase subunit M